MLCCGLLTALLLPFMAFNTPIAKTVWKLRANTDIGQETGTDEQHDLIIEREIAIMVSISICNFTRKQVDRYDYLF